MLLPFARLLPLLLVVALAACGGGSAGVDPDGPAGPEPVPAGIPIVPGGFVNWWDTMPTPDGTLGVVNATGQTLVAVNVTGTAGVETFLPSIAAGATWSSGVPFAPAFYLVECRGADGRWYRRYFRYDPDLGREAAVVSNANWDLGL